MADIPINAIDRRIQFTGNTGLGPFAFTFNILADSDIVVYKNDTLLTLTTDYTIATSADGTGSVTLTGSGNGTAVISSDFITIVGGRQLARTTDFVTAGDLLASSLNEQLDSNVIMVQQLDEKVERTLRIDQSDVTADMVLPKKASRANKTLGFDADGLPAVGEEIGDYKGNWAASTTYAIRDLVKDTSTNNIFRANTAHTSSGAQPLTTNTDSAKWDLIVDAASATTSATAAAASATAAANSATQATTNGAAQVTLATAQVALATTQANNAATSATTATTQASNASTSASAAAASAAAAAASADTFDDTYLGSKSSDPTVDNDGDPLNAGDLYFNTTSNELKVYNGSAWQTAAISATGLLTVANNLSDLASAATAQTNLGGTTVGKALFTAASVSAAQQAVDLEVGVDVQAFDADTAKLDVAQTFTAAQRGSTDTDATNTGSVTLDFAVNQNFVLTLTGNVTLANPTTETIGQSGFIVFIQDSTGGRTISLGTDYETAGAAGLTLSTAASTTDIVPYVVAASGRILLGTPQLAFA